jgi:hypothetical protein
LQCDPDDADARRLSGALSFGARLRSLDVSELDDAIRRCEALERDGGASSQLTRTLAVLYHRRALQAEARGRAADADWRPCLDYWKKNVFRDDSFWEGYTEEYNLGKGKRDQAKAEDVQRWRQDLPGELARGHAAYVSACLKRSDAAAVKRHLRLTWDWAPDFKPPDNFPVGDLGRLDDRMLEALGDALDGSASPPLRQALGPIVGGFWNGRAVDKANRAVDLLNAAVATSNRSVNLVNTLGPLARSSATQGLRSARSLAEDARAHVAEAKRCIDRARALAPELPAVKSNFSNINNLQNEMRKVLDAIASLLRQLGSY